MTKHLTLKVANMKKEQSFILYPYDGGDMIHLQSDNRWIDCNLRTGDAEINDRKRYKGHAGRLSLAFGSIKFKLPEAAIKDLQAHLWHNNGKEGNIAGVMFFENKELFSVIE